MYITSWVETAPVTQWLPLKCPFPFCQCTTLWMLRMIEGLTWRVPQRMNVGMALMTGPCSSCSSCSSSGIPSSPSKFSSWRLPARLLSFEPPALAGSAANSGLKIYWKIYFFIFHSLHCNLSSTTKFWMQIWASSSSSAGSRNTSLYNGRHFSFK